MGQDTQSPPAITINDYKLDSAHQLVYVGSTITDNLSLDTEINKRVRKAATTLTHPTSHVWSNFKLTVKTKMAVYNACILSTLHVLYDSETWTTYMYARQEKGLNSFHLRSICCILGISRQDKVTNVEVLCWPSHHTHPTETMPGALVKPRSSHGRRPHPKRHPLRRVCNWTKKHWLPATEIQGCL